MIQREMEPLSKAPKLSLCEVADVLSQQGSNLPAVSPAPSSVSKSEDHEGASRTTISDFFHEEEEENTQIQASLPFYFDHVFGSCIGHSQQSQAVASSPHFEPQSQYISPQSSLGFSLPGSRLLDSQGFIFNSSVSARNSPVPALSSASPVQSQTQPILDDTAKSASILQQSLVSPILSSPSSTSSSPGTRSNRSGTPVLFHSPSRSPGLINSPETRAFQYDKSTRHLTPQQSHHSKTEPLESHTSSNADPLQHTATDNQPSSNLICCVSKSSSISEDNPLRQRSKGRKRKLTFDSDASFLVNKLKYACPPSCTLLSECTHVHRTVSIFAVVLQGN